MTVHYCHLCGAQIDDHYRQFHHPEWPKEDQLRVCSDCLREKSRCKKCNIPISSLATNGYCVTCTQLEQRCLICGKRIRGRFWKINDLGPYCDKCRLVRPVCDLCGAPMGNEHWSLSDGRVFCNQCRDTRIFSSEEARALYTESKMVIDQVLGLRLNISTALVLVDRNQLTDIILQQSGDSNDLDIEKTMGIYTRRGIKRGIYVQTGLPRRLFLQVASHEHAHAWQGENCPLLSDVRFREGFAEWVAYHVLIHYGYQDLIHQMLNGNNIYSEGLTMMLELESASGKKGVIEACRRNR